MQRSEEKLNSKTRKQGNICKHTKGEQEIIRWTVGQWLTARKSVRVTAFDFTVVLSRYHYKLTQIPLQSATLLRQRYIFGAHQILLVWIINRILITLQCDATKWVSFGSIDLLYELEVKIEWRVPYPPKLIYNAKRLIMTRRRKKKSRSRENMYSLHYRWKRGSKNTKAKCSYGR